MRQYEEVGPKECFLAALPKNRVFIRACHERGMQLGVEDNRRKTPALQGNNAEEKPVEEQPVA